MKCHCDCGCKKYGPIAYIQRFDDNPYNVRYWRAVCNERRKIDVARATREKRSFKPQPQVRRRAA